MCSVQSNVRGSNDLAPKGTLLPDAIRHFLSALASAQFTPGFEERDKVVLRGALVHVRRNGPGRPTFLARRRAAAALS